MTVTLRGLYAITSDALAADDARLQAAVSAALRGGALLVQYRDKSSPPAQRLRQARSLAALCRDHGAALIVNDDPTLAAQAGAAGVHLGASDADPASARAVLGPQAIIGATCGNDLARAQTAIDAGVDYVAFGRLFASRSKPTAPPADLETLRVARARWRVPICAIGGLTPANAALAIDAGAHLIAAIDGVFGATDIESECRRYVDCFRNTQRR